MMLNKDHLSLTGFLTILTYYASINRGISKNVLKYYANIIPHGKLEVSLPDSLNPDWVSGFVAGGKNPSDLSDSINKKHDHR